MQGWCLREDGGDTVGKQAGSPLCQAQERSASCGGRRVPEARRPRSGTGASLARLWLLRPSLELPSYEV